MNFTCPYCNRPTTVTSPNHYSHWQKINISESTEGSVGLFFQAITCPNEECKKLYLYAELGQASKFDMRIAGAVSHRWRLLPESEARVLPDYIPFPIQQDYYESCRIRDLSPKASATLARRCLQGMIRNFWNITKDRLKDEIDALEAKIDVDTWASIDAVRSVGNIGAHMEKDINIIVDVEPGEAQLLIGLIEQLIDDWYVARESRRKRTEDLKSLAATKKTQKDLANENQ